MASQKRTTNSKRGKPDLPECHLEARLGLQRIRHYAREWAMREGIEMEPLTALAAAVGISRAQMFIYVPSGTATASARPARPAANTLILMAHVLGVPLEKLITWQIVDTRTDEVVSASS